MMAAASTTRIGLMGHSNQRTTASHRAYEKGQHSALLVSAGRSEAVLTIDFFVS